MSRYKYNDEIMVFDNILQVGSMKLLHLYTCKMVCATLGR